MIAVIRNVLPFALVGVAAANTTAQAAPCSVANCETCSASDANVCLICKDDFGLDAGICYDASVTCSNPLFNQRTGINKNGVCCIELNCMECSTSNMCTQCNHGYFLDNRNHCVKCPTIRQDALCINGKGCHNSEMSPASCCGDNCAVCDDAGSCKVCLNGETTATCSSCVEGDTRFGCAVCGSSRCEICMPNFTMTAFGCQPCPEDCAEGCGYTGDGAQQSDMRCCRRVQGHCASCNFNPSLCEKCNLGFYATNYKCEACHESCVTCRVSYHGASAEYCCPANCAECDAEGCNMCFGGFTLDAVTKTCA